VQLAYGLYRVGARRGGLGGLPDFGIVYPVAEAIEGEADAVVVVAGVLVVDIVKLSVGLPLGSGPSFKLDGEGPSALLV